MNEDIEERMLDLLCRQAVYGLTEQEAKELSEFRDLAESPIDAASLEMTAAAIAVTSVSQSETLPDHLKAGILASANQHFEAQRAANAPVVPTVSEKTKPVMSILGWLGWAAATVACVALAINIYQYRPDGRANIGPTPSPIPQKPAMNQLREQLIANAGDIVRAEWGPGNVKDLSVGGDVVWSDAKQEGYLRFRGLPKNDASKYTYQLWIFDENQDEKTPIDGGVFNVNADGEIIIPIDAKLRARGAKAFAVTMEKPGGVMVSKRDRVVSLAAVKPNQA